MIKEQTEAELLVTISQKKAQRQADCIREIQEILQKYNCSIIPHVIISDNSLQSKVEVKANDYSI